MLIYIIRRINLLVITLFLLSFIAFFLQQQIALNSADNSFLSDYPPYLLSLLSGDLGVSSVSGRPVMEDILRVFPATLELCFTAFVVSIFFGVPLGTLAGLSRGGPVDYTIMTITLLGVSVPAFWLAMLTVIFFSLQLGWFPVSGRIGLLYEIPNVTGFILVDTLLSDDIYAMDAFKDALRHIALPTLVLATVPTTEVIREVRYTIGEVMKQNYIKAALTKGLSKWEIVLRHALRNALPPVIPVLGLQFGSVITTAMITETVFNWPGIGPWLVQSIGQNDYAAIQGGLLLVASFVLLASVFTDLFFTLIYPLKRRALYART